MRLTVAALLLIALPACSSSTHQVKTEQNWDTDFTRYRTYAWSQGVAARDPAVESRIRAAVDFELPFKGLRQVKTASSPDLYVSTYAAVEDEQVIDHGLPSGTLMINLVDARTGKLVWRGRAAHALDVPVSDATLRQVTREIFRHYPHRR